MQTWTCIRVRSNMCTSLDNGMYQCTYNASDYTNCNVTTVVNSSYILWLLAALLAFVVVGIVLMVHTVRRVNDATRPRNNFPNYANPYTEPYPSDDDMDTRSFVNGAGRTGTQD